MRRLASLPGGFCRFRFWAALNAAIWSNTATTPRTGLLPGLCWRLTAHGARACHLVRYLGARVRACTRHLGDLRYRAAIPAPAWSAVAKWSCPRADLCAPDRDGGFLESLENALAGKPRS
jgi:hypothetical protein